MTNSPNTTNSLINETSPYLLQHAHNPVDWYAWGNAAFEKAKKEDKPIFLSIGYSTCHWCHVMEHESFENTDVAQILNENFISIKVDKEERPDVDSIYMRVCQAFTGNGGWPTSIFMTHDQKPFFAGTYFPREGFTQILNIIIANWKDNRQALVNSGDELIEMLNVSRRASAMPVVAPINDAVLAFEQIFDSEYGGFGQAPKFPSPHNLMFLLYTNTQIAEKTLQQMYKGGIFDHIGYGFSRYSTDRYWLAPHFEKMLYDNALLSIAYLLAFEKTGKEFYKSVAEKVLLYVSRELASPTGGFFSAQDADSDGVEGKYYTFNKSELVTLLGENDAQYFNAHFGITERGNFEHQNIPNLIANKKINVDHFAGTKIDGMLPKVYEYRLGRTHLHLDNKILTAWNSLMLAAYAMAYRITGECGYLDIMTNTINFIEAELTEGDKIYSSITNGALGAEGFLDDYAFYIYALINAHQATQNEQYLTRAVELMNKVVSNFKDDENGGFFFNSANSENLILRPKETTDNAIPSGNSVMAFNLDRLAKLTKDDTIYQYSNTHQQFMNREANRYPSAYAFYLYSMLPTKDIVCVLKDDNDIEEIKVASDWTFKSVKPSEEYPLINDMTTYYVCEGGACLPPRNQV